MINRVVLIGRMTKDPEIRTTTNGKAVVSFSIAVTKKFKPQDRSPDADFFSVTAWDKTAEYVSSYLGKGRLIAVDGRLQTRKYTGSDGVSREVVDVVADNVHGLDRPKDDSSPKKATGPVMDEWDPFAEE